MAAVFLPAALLAAACNWTNTQPVIAGQGDQTGCVSVAWMPVEQASAYEVWRAVSNRFPSASLVAEVASNSWDDLSVECGLRYYYWLRARTLEGIVPLGNGGAVCGHAGLPPPEFVSASDGEYTNKILVAWSAVSNAAGYEIWRNTTNDDSGAVCLAVTAGTAYEDASAAEATLYLYWITATNNVCRSAPSLYDTGFRQLPAPPRLKASDNTYTDRVQIAWGVISNALSYEIWRGVKDSCEAAEKLAVVESNAWKDTTAMPGVFYYYWVRAVSDVGLGAFSRPGKGRRKCLIAQLPPPARIKASDGDFADKVFISWSVVSNACGYEVWRGESTNAPMLIGVSFTNFYEDKAALTGVVYGYKLRSTNAFAMSAFSRVDNGFVGEPKVPPAPPTGVTAAQGTVPAAVRIQWVPSPDAKGYEIWRGVSAQPAAASPIGSAPARATVFNDASALPGTRYTYWLRSVSGVMTGNFSAACSGFRPLPPPAAPAASPGTFTDKIRLQWQAVTNAGLYEIWRSPSNTFASAMRVSSASSTGFDDATALPGVRYFYWVRAISAACPGMPSMPVVGYRPLPAPRDVSASDGSFPDRVQVTWKAVPNALRYEVWRSLTNSTAGARRIGFCATPEFADRSAAPGARYHYFVRAAGTAGLGPFSESNAGHRMPKPPNRAIGAGGVSALAVPATLNATDGAFTDKVRLSWKAVPGAAAYEILRGLADHPNRAVSIGKVKSLAFDDLGAEPGREYNYWVRGVNDLGAGALSAGTKGHRQLPAPLNFSAAGSEAGISLAWNNVAQAGQYEIWRNTTAHSASAVLLVKTARAAFEDTSAAPGVAYTYWVRARNDISLSPYSEPLSASRPPAAPTGLEASRGAFNDRVHLSWKEPEGATGYEVWRASSPDRASAVRLTSPSATAFDDMTAAPGAAFVYWVRARSPTGPGAFSAPATGHRPLDAPAGIVASRGTFTEHIRISWRPVTNTAGYEIWRSPVPQQAAAEQAGVAAGTNFDDFAAATTADFWYWVRATNTLGPGLFSTSNSGFRALCAPDNLSASDGLGTAGVWLAWSQAPEASGYELWRSASEKTASARRIATVASTNYFDATAPQGLLQWYWLKATNAARVSAFSPSNSGFRLLGPPADINASDGTFVDKVRVTWKPAANASGYEVWRAAENDFSRAALVGHAGKTAWDDEGPPEGTTNFYWVRATNTLCAGVLSEVDSGYRGGALHAPAAPRNVSASDGAYLDKVRITWKASSDAASYRLYRSPPELDTLTLIGETSDCVFDDFSARPGMPYAYQVAGQNSVGVGAFSAPDSGRRGGAASAPQPPIGISASDGLFDDRILVAWKDVFDADIFEVWRGLADSPESAVKVAEVEGCAFEDFDVVRGARYHYRLRARNASGVSSFSACDAGYAGSQPVRVAVAADYDGDGVSDLALFHPETGEWFVQSINGELLAYGAYWGGAGFLTLQGDFDGDGACDFAAYDADSGAWYVSSLEGRIIVFGEVWGGPGWIPVAGDYDGDGAADLAVYEPATGLWNIRSVAGKVLLSGFTWGGEGFVPLAAPASLP